MTHKFQIDKRIWLIVVALLVLAMTAACTSVGDTEPADQPGENSSLVGTDWDLVTYDDQKALPDGALTVRFTEDEINGSAGCNNYFGGYTLDGVSISIDRLGSTEMACDGLMEQEAAFLQMLQTAESFTLDADSLIIHTTEGNLVFKQKEDLTLTGTEWTLNGIAQDEAFVSTAIDSEITAVFENDQIAGSAGCNDYFAAYETDGDALTLGTIGSTMMMCEDEQNQREMEFLTALESVTGYSISRNTLTLTDADNNPLIIFQAQRDNAN
ncbi:MAG: META domain-containing protein [Chloroflexi bacterium]|nr:META domain-containing protein [Chloroflexota bacterium]